MRPLLVALAVVSLAVSGCGDDDGGSEPDTDADSKTAQAYLADLEEAGLDDLYEDDETAIAYVATACANAKSFGQTPEELIASGAVSEQAAVALAYCDSDLAG